MNSIVIAIEIINAVETRFASTGDTNPPKIASTQGRFLSGYGEKMKEATISVDAWNGVGEQLTKYQPGQALLVKGRIDIAVVETPNGKASKATLVISEICQVLPSLVKVNCINIAGNVGQDPDVKYFESGANVAKTSIAVNAGKNKTNWFSVELWSKPAEVMANYVHRGDKIGVTGELQFETWNDKQTGELRSKPSVKGDNLSLLGKSGNAAVSAPTSQHEEEF